MLSEKNRAILLMAQTKSSNDKAKRMCDSHTKVKAKGKAEAMVKPDGQAEWVRFKSECVLLMRKGKR